MRSDPLLLERILGNFLSNALRYTPPGGCVLLAVRLADGLAAIEPHDGITAISLCGMGGETILGILEAAPWTHEDVHTLILQPQTKIDLLRCWLCGHGYRFLSETLVRDKEQLYVVFRSVYFPVG